MPRPLPHADVDLCGEFVTDFPCLIYFAFPKSGGPFRAFFEGPNSPFHDRNGMRGFDVWTFRSLLSPRDFPESARHEQIGGWRTRFWWASLAFAVVLGVAVAAVTNWWWNGGDSELKEWYLLWVRDFVVLVCRLTVRNTVAQSFFGRSAHPQGAGGASFYQLIWLQAVTFRSRILFVLFLELKL